MFTSWRIARIFGIDLFIHWTFWLLPLWIVLTFEGSEAFPMWMHLAVIAALFTCIVLHELGHALMAREFGIGTHSVTLSPLGGIAQLERMSDQPWEEFCIAIAGPLVNVVIAAVLALGLAGGYLLAPAIVDGLLFRFLTILLGLNVVMVVFNMIPAFPMDGGRVLRALLAAALGLLEGTRVAVGVGMVTAILMALTGFFLLGNPWLLLIGLFVIFAGQQELRALEMKEHQLRADAEEALPTPLATLRPRSAGSINVWRWDSARHVWVRQPQAPPSDHADA